MKARQTLAWNIIRIRVERRLSQEALSFAAGIDMSHLAAIETERANPTIDLIEQVARALAVDISELLTPFPPGSTRPAPMRPGRKPPKVHDPGQPID